jgi:hypothetical protein
VRTPDEIDWRLFTKRRAHARARKTSAFGRASNNRPRRSSVRPLKRRRGVILNRPSTGSDWSMATRRNWGCCFWPPKIIRLS